MADLALVAVMAIWGSSFALMRFFLSGGGGDVRGAASPLLLLCARMAISCGLLAGFLALRPEGRKQLAALRAPGAFRRPGSLLRDGALVGLLLAGGFLLQTEGLARTTASRSGFLTGLVVLFTPLLELLLFRRRPSLPTLAGLVLAFAGMASLAGPLDGSGAATLVGDLLTVACAFVFAGHIVALGRVSARHPVLPLLLLQLCATGLVAASVGPFAEVPRLPADPRLWAAIVYLALFATLLAFGVQTWAQRKVTPVRMALLSTLEPVFAALWAALLLGERLAPHEWRGAALILSGVVVGEVGAALWPARPAAPAPELPGRSPP